MTFMLIPLLSALGYLLAAGWLVRDHTLGLGKPRLALVFVVPAIALQALAHAVDWHALNGPDLHFFSALSLVGLGMAALTTIAALSQRMGAVGIVCARLAAVA